MKTTISMAATTVPRVVHPYKTRNGGATVTVFVPYNCHNHCPFCINKAEYEDMTGFSEEAICQSIRLQAAAEIGRTSNISLEKLTELLALFYQEDE